jgi:molybdopterin-containing oxidoreductase family iron-sulfur binding subunit
MKPDLTQIRQTLANARGPAYWRSLEELANTPEFQQWMADEFPSRAGDIANPASRREVLRTMGAMIAMASLAGCVRQPTERILPYVRQPEDLVPGKPLMFATTMPFRGCGIGVLVESHEGRPTKVEGNPLHPASLGRTTVFQQASTLDLYDPDRSKAVMFRGRISSYGQLLNAVGDLRKNLGDGTGLAVLADFSGSPTLLAQRDSLMSRYPKMRWTDYDPAGVENAAEGARIAFGVPVNTTYRFDLADVVVSLDADFLQTPPGSIAYARQFVSRRHAEADRARMNRLYVVEPTPTITGDKADHRIRMRAADVEAFARALHAAVTSGQAGNAPAQVIARDLLAHRGASLIVPGEMQPPAVHAIAHAINAALGNNGVTSIQTESTLPPANTLPALVDDMRNGRIKTLLILGANPVYNAPADLDFAGALEKVPLRIHLGSHYDETASRCHWHVPQSHYLESWSDAIAYDGTASIVQPLIDPLYPSKTAHEFLAILTDTPDQSSYRLVREFWQSQNPGNGFDAFWERALHDGVVPGTAFRPRPVSAKAALPPQTNAGAGIEIVFRPDPTVWDGRFANNGWLQECPKPHTKLTWDNAALISPATAQRLNVKVEDVIEIKQGDRSIQIPVWITPGQADDSITVTLGYGRTAGGRVAEGAGANAFAIRTMQAPYFLTGANIRKTGARYALVSTQDHGSMEGRDIVRSAANQEYLSNPKLFHHEEREKLQGLQLYPEWEYKGHAWGMAIDQNACIGCNACVVGCQAENNIAVVGKDQVARGREMHWLRIDRYFVGEPSDPRTHYQPMLCQHCEKAPCEPVCPVAATVHSGEGLNQMVYNRCIGTRYCSNNCPYKVRRFNFLLYQDWDTPSLEPLRNPDVTVRSRGVMEKCTFCTQRIQEAKIEAEKQNRPLRDGEVVTACQGACPTDAIVFGDINDKSSRVAKLRQNNLAYTVLAELGTQPRVVYMAELRNPNPELA